LFDYVDIVFLDGDGNLLPWMRKCEKLKILFKMCKITNKCLFASGFGMQMLVNYCATCFAEVQVINGGERGGPLTTIKEVPAKLVANGGAKSNLVFLDNLTGDYYALDEKSSQWKPQGNFGLHYSRAMASLGGSVGGDLVKKVSTYQSKVTDLKP
jgi:hypothetical protein